MAQEALFDVDFLSPERPTPVEQSVERQRLSQVLRAYKDADVTVQDNAGYIAGLVAAVAPSGWAQPFWSVSHGRLRGTFCYPVAESIMQWTNEFGNGRLEARWMGGELAMAATLVLVGHCVLVSGTLTRDEAVEELGSPCLSWTGIVTKSVAELQDR
ncbi:hypothetical protein [Haloglycomyces albus]|uniref:hypothetical protein n=1 Tax=Haloglycomyces albus TaxID=526067 RepID=UPI00046D7730|nr:hypothetical protein [Haloglycomyces albus]